MKNLFVFLSVFSFAFVVISSDAGLGRPKKVIDETLVTCEQVGGNVWYQVGIVALKNSLEAKALVVRNDEKGETLVANRTVIVTKKDATGLVFEDSWHTFKLDIDYTKEVMMGFSGSLYILKDGPGELIKKNLQCFPQSSISYEFVNLIYN